MPPLPASTTMNLCAHKITSPAFDTAFASNYLDHWLFTLLLLQSMDRETGRVIIVGGMVHE
jgi:NAD(P)-dependent dehydrogenase (short-subunit alcohol dehydrogenase family)